MRLQEKINARMDANMSQSHKRNTHEMFLNESTEIEVIYVKFKQESPENIFKFEMMESVIEDINTRVNL